MRQNCEREGETRNSAENTEERISEKYERECERKRANTSLMAKSSLSPVPLLTTLISSTLTERASGSLFAGHHLLCHSRSTTCVEKIDFSKTL